LRPAEYADSDDCLVEPTRTLLCLPVPSTYWAVGSRCLPQAFMMKPTDAWHCHPRPWLGGCTLRDSGASFASDKCVRVRL